MSDSELQYLLPEQVKEVARLTEQDATIIYMIDNKRSSPVPVVKSHSPTN